MKTDIVAVGSCYVDTIATDYPFGEQGIPADKELVGGAYKDIAGSSAINFCRLMQRLGSSTMFIGMAGDDEHGDTLEKLLRQDGIVPELIRVKGLQTNICLNISNPTGQHIMLVLGTANAQLESKYLLPKLQDTLQDARTLYLGGVFKLKVLAPDLHKVAAVAKEHGVAIAVDHGRIPDHTTPEHRAVVRELVLAADYYFPSYDEFCELWEVDDISQGLATLAKKVPSLQVVVKDGARGAVYWDGDHAQTVPIDRKVTGGNLTGAGDSFNAGFLAAAGRGLDVPASIKFGHTVAAAHISGAETPRLPKAR